jgi:aspartyl-tRNA(Asn)/glutamyl-tRNA(Gln) amidotransferase subunit B
LPGRHLPVAGAIPLESAADQIMTWETVVGFEIHTELLTKSKVFCGCSTDFGQPPNTEVCPICLGMPGTLPVLNKKAFELAMRAALALNCTITRRTQFERKNYYYPDLPKNYQISQLRKNLGENGWIDITLPDGSTKRVGIDNVHLEEDAGKNIHGEDTGITDGSLVDLNRAGTPLLEIVSRPDLGTQDEAQAYMVAMKSLLEYTGVSDCNMHEGRLRFEANISVRRTGEPLGTKVEIKNLNSMKVVQKCIEVETKRQIEALEAGERIVQETRLWDEPTYSTRAMRSKEQANDYRYFPDPDLLEVEIDDAWLERVRGEIPELPEARRARFISEFGLPPYDALVLTEEKARADYYETAVATHANPKGIANWMMTEALRWLNDDPERTIEQYPIKARDLAELVKLIDDKTISGKIAKDVYKIMMELNGAQSPATIVKERGLVQVTDTAAIEKIVDEVLAANEQIVKDFLGGKDKALGALVGQVMKASKGKANPQMANELILKKVNAAG